MSTAQIAVPATFQRGQTLKLKLSDGREVTVTVPDDVKAGGTFTWTMPAEAANLVGEGATTSGRISTSSTNVEARVRKPRTSKEIIAELTNRVKVAASSTSDPAYQAMSSVEPAYEGMSSVDEAKLGV